MQSNKRIMYLRDKNKKPIACLAIAIERSMSIIGWQISTLNPEDNLVKSMGRELAIGRLVSRPYLIKGIPADITLHDITALVMADVSVSKEIPTRAIRAAKRWLNTKPTHKREERDTLV